MLAVAAGQGTAAQAPTTVVQPQPATLAPRPPAAAQAVESRDLQATIQAIEDQRPESDDALAPLRRSLRAGPGVQALAVRAMGRLERAALVPEIAPLLDSPVPAVRIEAATALGQAVIRADAGPARAALTARARVERDPEVLGEIARTIGRLPYKTELEIRDAERLLVEIAAGEEAVRLVGVAHGFDALARRAVKLGSLSMDARRRLRTLARYGSRATDVASSAPSAPTATATATATAAQATPTASTAPTRVAAPTAPTASTATARPGAASAIAASNARGEVRVPASALSATGPRSETAAVPAVSAAVSVISVTSGASADMSVRVRRLAVSALVTARESNAPLVRQVLRDPDEQVRRLGVLWLAVTDEEAMPQRDEAFRQALADGSPMVRYEALRAHAAARQSSHAAASAARTTSSPAGSADSSATAAAVSSASPVPSTGSAASTAGGGAAAASSTASPAVATTGTPPPTTTDSSPSTLGGGAAASAVAARAAATAPAASEVNDASQAVASSTSAAGPCAVEVAALSDGSPHVVLLAIDLLGRCGDRQVATDRLTSYLSAFWASPRDGRNAVEAAAGGKVSWHYAARALVALARVAPDRAGEWLVRAAAHDVWQVRMYAARAAGVLDDRATLDTLAVDSHDNVRHAAIEALQPLAGHDADALYLAALDRSDYQLVRAAARALVGTPRRADAADRAVKAFVRLSAARRDTSRDARMALLETLSAATTTPAAATATGTTAAPTATAATSASGATPAAAGTTATSVTTATAATAATSSGASPDGAVEALRPYLSDFDPVVAARVATLLTTWTGRPHTAAPVRPPSVRVPSPREIVRLRGLQADVRMARGGTFTLALRADVAPTNVARFVRLVRAGYFNGLTFHRVEPNFVLQGGSPGANEYAGDGPYTRDELDRTSNLRGTVGVSTRGRDTGDGQIYVNLVDNVRLDHNYTVFADVVNGMAVLDGILEGDVIARIVLREAR